MKLNNPVFSSEMRVRMRSWKTAIGIGVYMLVMIVLAMLFFLFTVVLDGRGLRASEAAEVGRGAYALLASFQFAMLIFIIPAQTAGVISGEREKQTLDLLLVTRMSPASIVLGKLMSSLGYALLLILSSMPVFSLVFLFGGLSLPDVATLFGFYLVMAFASGAIGVFCSTYMRRTVTATVVAYLIVLAIGIGTLITGGFEISYMNYLYQQSSTAVNIGYPISFYLNPALALASLLTSQITRSSGGMMGFLGLGSSSATPGGLPIWVISMLVIAAIGVGLVLLSIAGLRPARNIANRGGKPKKGKANDKA